MDTLTHALSGMLVAQASRARAGEVAGGLSLRSRLTAGFLAAAFPDIDFLMWFFGDLSYLNHHRGVTHSIIMLPVWALLLAMGFAWLSRGRYHWRQFYVVSALAIGIHILGDVITAYGTMILAPFSRVKYAFPTTFILDPWFSGIILLALLLAWVFKSQARRIALAGLLVLVSYVGYQGYLHQRAVDIAAAYRAKQGWQTARVAALPQFLSPYYWKLVVTHHNEYHVAYVNLMQGESAPRSEKQAQGFIARFRSSFKGADDLNWRERDRYGKQKSTQQLARTIWSLDMFGDIRHFMQYPVLDRIEHRAEGTCGIFIDLRFVTDGLRAPPFQFGACRNRQRTWHLYRFKSGQGILLK